METHSFWMFISSSKIVKKDDNPWRKFFSSMYNTYVFSFTLVIVNLLMS